MRQLSRRNDDDDADNGDDRWRWLGCDWYDDDDDDDSARRCDWDDGCDSARDGDCCVLDYCVNY